MTATIPAPARGAEGPAPLRLPDAGLLFDARAARFQVLAQGHPAEEWLLLLSRIAAGQALAVREVPARRIRAAGDGPPLPFDRIARNADWRRMLRNVLASSSQAPRLPVETRDALSRLAGAGAAELEALADGVLARRLPQGALPCAPFVGAALQAWLAALARAIDPSAVPPAQGACPVCGGPPLAGTIQRGDRLRYVTCALCSAEWNVLRVRCALCAGEDVEYLHAEGDRGSKAEACRSCRAYVKLFDEELRPGADAAADDAATLVLDILVADEGYRRAGPNLYLAAGLCEEEPVTPRTDQGSAIRPGSPHSSGSR